MFFALVSSRYERASMIVSSNKPFSAWAETFGDPVAVAAMVDWLVQHAEIISLKGDSYRLKERRKEVVPLADRPVFDRREPSRIQPPLTNISALTS